MASTFKTILNKSSESGHPCLIPDVRDHAFSFSPLSIMLAVGLLYIAYVEVCSLYAHFMEFFFFFFKNGIFLKIIYFWLCWALTAAHGLSLVAVSGGYSLLQYTGFSLWWLLLLWSTGSRHMGFSSCGLSHCSL